MPSRGRMVNPTRSPGQGFHCTAIWRQTPGQALGSTGGDKHVASLEHRTHVVETRHTGGRGRRGLVRVRLHHAWGLQLDTLRPTP
jgi:hypothetical protein